MSKRVNAKYKIERRLGTSLWGRAKSPFNRGKEYGPGQHGQHHGKPTDYGVQLRAKQRLKGYYGNVSEKQLHKYYTEAIRRKGDTSENLIGLLESRLDAVVYHMKFVPTVFAARQLVNHGHILVNGKRVDIPSYLLKAGDTVEVREKAKTMPLVIEAIASAERGIPDYLQVDEKNLSGVFVRVPALADVPYACAMEPNLVVEFYSR